MNKIGISHKDAMNILLHERASEFNPILLECLEEIQENISRAMQDGGRNLEVFNEGSAYKKMIEEAGE